MKLHIELEDSVIIDKLILSDLSMKGLHELFIKVKKELESRTHLG
jgi:hypothetical protein